jgi:putative ABC transport system permease protein
MQIFMLIREFLEDIRTQKTRAFLTTIAISWGIIAVTLLMAFGEGLSFRMREGFINAGDRIIRVYSGQTTKKWEGLPIGRRILLREDDCRVIEENIPQVAVAVPGSLPLIWKEFIQNLNIFAGLFMVLEDVF